MSLNISVWEGKMHTAHGTAETLEDAKEVALAFSRQYRGVIFTIHDGGKVHFRARGGQLLDEDGNPLAS
jgi:hypothetical protein